VLQLCHVSPPADIEFDGEALSDVFLGNSDRSRNRPLFFRRPPDRPAHNQEGNLPDLAVRDGNWKLLCDYDGSNPQLYNLATDPSEKSNVAERHPDIANRLTKLLLAWNQSMPSDKGATYAALNKPLGKPRKSGGQRK
jgi:uncharacterized sulfatase